MADGKQTADKLLEAIDGLIDAGRPYPTNHIRNLAEAYAWLVSPSNAHGSVSGNGP